jgi:hypothetical protein
MEEKCFEEASRKWNSPRSQKHFGALLAMKELPSREQLEALGAHISNDICSFVSERLSREDRALWIQGDDTQSHWPEASMRRIWNTIDHVIIERAESTYCGLVYVSSYARMRICHWNLDPEYGFRSLEALHRAVERGNRVRLGKDKLPIAEMEWRANKKKGVGELRRLFKQLKFVFGNRRNAPTFEEVWDWAERAMLESAASFEFLPGNLRSLRSYIEYAATQDESIKARFVLGQLRPGQLFDDWGAHSRNLTPKNFSQSIARLSKP